MARAPSGRRQFGAAVLLCVAGGGLVLLAGGRPWARALLVRPPLATVTTTVSGRSLAPVLAALGLMGLAGVVALVATRGAARVATGVLLALAGAGAVAIAVTVWLDLDGRARPALEQVAGVPAASAQDIRPTPWPSVAVLGGVLLCVGGAVTAVRGRRWSTLSARHEPPGGRQPADAGEADTRESSRMWDALDRGQDPTRPPP